MRAANLPEHHRDPADRMIIATALHHGIQLASLDGNFPAYQEVQLISSTHKRNFSVCP